MQERWSETSGVQSYRLTVAQASLEISAPPTAAPLCIKGKSGMAVAALCATLQGAEYKQVIHAAHNLQDTTRMRAHDQHPTFSSPPAAFVASSRVSPAWQNKRKGAAGQKPEEQVISQTVPSTTSPNGRSGAARGHSGSLCHGPPSAQQEAIVR